MRASDGCERPWLVTGASGFLGSYVVNHLLERGQATVALDGLNWGRPGTLRAFASRPGCSAVVADIRDAEAIARVFERFRPGQVVHLAALHFIPSAVDDPARAVGINVLGTQVVLGAALAAGADRFWFASTGDVYAPSSRPHHEDDRVAPSNVYGLTKWQGEQLIALASRSSPGTRFVIGRLFNLYGPGETNPHFLPELLGQLRARPGGPVRLGSLWPCRDFVPVGDAARAVVETTLAAAAGIATVNIASGAAVAMEEVVATLGTILGVTIPVELDPAKVRPAERDSLQADVSRLRAWIGWTPHADLVLGLTELLRAEDPER
jgi:UDP-glucose 4-epimerase